MEAYRSEEPVRHADPLSALFFSMLKSAYWDAVYGGHFDEDGRPTMPAYSARKWLMATTGTRRFPVLSADYCLHAVEDEIRIRISRQAHKRFTTAEDYRQFLLSAIHQAWLARRLKALESVGQMCLLHRFDALCESGAQQEHDVTAIKRTKVVDVHKTVRETYVGLFDFASNPERLARLNRSQMHLWV